MGMTKGHIKLTEYFSLPSNMPKGAKRHFARQVGVAPYTLSRYIAGDIPCVRVIKAMEKVSAGFIKAADWMVDV